MVIYFSLLSVLNRTCSNCFNVTPCSGLRSSSQMPVSTCLLLSPGSYYLSFSYYELLWIYLFYIWVYYFRSFPIYIYTNIYIYMGTRWIKLSFFFGKQLLCNPYGRVVLWFCELSDYIWIYGYKHIYPRINLLSFQISYIKNISNYLWDIPLIFI